MEFKRNLRVFFRRKLRDREYLLRLGIVIGFVSLMTLIIPRSVRQEYRHEVGDIWTKPSLVAKTSFVVMKNPDTLAAQQQRVRGSVPPILVQLSSATEASIRAATTAISRFRRHLGVMRDPSQAVDSNQLYQQAQTFFQAEINIDPAQFPPGESWIDRMENQIPYLANRLEREGYCSYLPPSELRNYVRIRVGVKEELELSRNSILVGDNDLRNWLNEQLGEQNDPANRLLKDILQASIVSTLVFDEAMTTEVRDERVRWVSVARERVDKGDIIVRKDALIDGPTSQRIHAYFMTVRNMGGIEPQGGMVIGRFLLIFLITLLMLTFLRINRPRIYFFNQRLSLVLSTILLVVGAMVVATKLNDVALQFFNRADLNLSYIYLAPACIVPIFMSNFFDHRVAFFSNLVVAFSGAVLVQQGLEYAFVQLIAGTVAVYSLRRLRKREVFFYTLGFIFLGYAISYITFNLFSKGNLDTVNLNTVLLFGINVLLTIIAYNLIYLFEQIFRVTSDLTYLELLDTNHPLLKELAKKAPGTFQHSLQVANIAEAVVNEVGGNALLIHVGALYHDIGKMINPRYFIENQPDSPNKETPHQKLNCLESAEIIINHVTKGVSIAQRYHLPRELIHFIETHHGTTRVEFFYRKHLKDIGCKPPVDEDMFRYPGPLPFSKETAILMMADSVEAASRSLKNPTIDSLESLVEKIVDAKIADNQLVNSPLTFHDISILREILKKQLITIYHGRIEYPKEQPEKEPA